MAATGAMIATGRNDVSNVVFPKIGGTKSERSIGEYRKIVTTPSVLDTDIELPVFAGAAEETGAAASQVLGAASELSRQSEHLNTEVDRFLATVRAA